MITIALAERLTSTGRQYLSNAKERSKMTINVDDPCFKQICFSISAYHFLQSHVCVLLQKELHRGSDLGTTCFGNHTAGIDWTKRRKPIKELILCHVRRNILDQ